MKRARCEREYAAPDCDTSDSDLLVFHASGCLQCTVYTKSYECNGQNLNTHHHHLSVAYVVAVPNDLYKLLHKLIHYSSAK